MEDLNFYEGEHTGQQIDQAVDRALPDGALDQRIDAVTYGPATEISDGLMTAADKTALDSVPTTYQTKAITDAGGYFTDDTVEDALQEIGDSYQTKAITDAGGYFTNDTVEGALQELGASMGGGAHFASGQYTGDGKYGSSNPVSITLDFVPKFVMCGPSGQYQNTYPAYFIWMYGITKSKVFVAYQNNWIPPTAAVDFSLSGTTLSWTSTSTEANMNTNGLPYTWVAFG